MMYVVVAVAVVAVAAMVAVTLIAWRRLPAFIPTGYDFRTGVPVRWGDRRVLWTTPALFMMIAIVAFDPQSKLGTANEVTRVLLLTVIAGYCAAVTWYTAEIARKQRDRLPKVLNPALWMIAVVLLGIAFLKGS